MIWIICPARDRRPYGPERLQRDLSDNGVVVGVHRIKRIRRKLGLRCRQKRKLKVTTDSRHSLPVAGSLLNQKFEAGKGSSRLLDPFLFYRLPRSFKSVPHRYLTPIFAGAEGLIVAGQPLCISLQIRGRFTDL